MQARDLASWPNHESSRFVEAGGVRWHVQQSGRGPSLLLVHGTGASTHSWRDLFPALAPYFTLLAPDLPGHGFTSAAPGSSSIPAMSRSLAALLGRLGVQPQYCVGHSAGAVILCRLALDGDTAPSRIIAINGAFVPLNGIAGIVFAPLARLMAHNALLPLWIAHRAARSASVLKVIESTGSRLSVEGSALYVRLMSDVDHVTGTLRMLSDWDLHTFARDLPKLKTPLTLFVGENDRTVPPAQAGIVQQKLPATAIQRLPGLGHLAHEEAPYTVADEIRRVFELRSESTRT